MAKKVGRKKKEDVKEKVEEVKEEKEVKEEVKEEVEDVKEEPVKEEKVEPKPEEKVEESNSNIDPVITGYFERYIEAIEKNKPQEAIKYMANMFIRFITNFNSDSGEYLIEMFKKHKNKYLAPQVALQGIESQPYNTRQQIEYLYTIFGALSVTSKNEHLPKIAFDRVRPVLKNEELLNWLISKYKKISKG